MGKDYNKYTFPLDSKRSVVILNVFFINCKIKHTHILFEFEIHTNKVKKLKLN